MVRCWPIDFTWSANKTFVYSTTEHRIFWSINFTNLSTFTASTWYARLSWKSTSNTITSWWKIIWWDIIVDCITWKYTVLDNIEFESSKYFQLVTWTLDFNDFNIKCRNFSWQWSWVRTLYMGNWTLEVVKTSSELFNIDTTTNLTFYAEWSTIKMSWVLTWVSTFKWWWLTYNNIWNATTWNYKITYSWSNIFNDFKSDEWRQNYLTASTTNTVTTFTMPKTWTKVIFRSSSTTNATLAKAWWWVIDTDYIDIDYITWSPANTWYMWTNSTDGWHNTNIYFTAPPSLATWNMFMMF